MRLPMGADDRVDRAAAIPLLRRAVDLGINYFDTAIFYCKGDSQRAVGEALRPLRGRVVLSTKNHLHDAPEPDWRARLEESLALLQTDYLDLYTLHGLTWEAWEKHIRGPAGKLRLMQKARDEGLIRHIACSFHDTPDALRKLLETGVFECVTVQYNLLNRDLAPVLHRAAELDIGVVVMGPVGGGRLGVDSARIRELTGGAASGTPEAALRFVLAHPAVHVALSGMSSIEMLEQNARIVSEQPPFTEAQVAALDAEIQRVRERMGVPCTACGYCQPCPAGVDIPGLFGVYNTYRIYGLREPSLKAYAALKLGGGACTACGACLPKCPQKIRIPERIREAHADLAPPDATQPVSSG